MLVVVTVSRTWNSDRMCQQTQSWTLFTEQVACFKQSVRHGPCIGFPHYCGSIYFKLARLILVCSSAIQVAIDPGLRVAVSGVLRRTGYLVRGKIAGKIEHAEFMASFPKFPMVEDVSYWPCMRKRTTEHWHKPNAQTCVSCGNPMQSC